MNLPSKDAVPDTIRSDPRFKGAYLFGLSDAAAVVLDHMKHSDNVEEVLFGQAIVIALRKIGHSI